MANARINVTSMRVDGGASANNLLMQTQSDFLGIPVVRSGIAERKHQNRLVQSYPVAAAPRLWRWGW